ncbi:MAG: hypothetical protein M0T80_04640 [Actinomycetota bacterium]|nr:hypothetical protein [Actinomycetota bacterium]
MSTLWTPSGEHPVGRSDQPRAEAAPSSEREPTEAELQAEMAAMAEQLSRTPAEVVVVEHAVGLWQLAALHLSAEPPRLGEARVAIDAFGALVEGMAGRLGEAEPQLIGALDQLRLAYVERARAAGGPAVRG